LNLIAAHTNWDAAPGGINDALASRLGLIEVEPFGWAEPVGGSKIVTFCPQEATQSLIGALSESGAGQIGAYSRCAFWTEGTGTYLAGPGANPMIGLNGQIESVPEDRLEMAVPTHHVVGALRALKAAHPYEAPAIDVYPFERIGEMPFGRIGRLPVPMALSEFGGLVDEQLETASLVWGDPSKRITRVALVGGSADGDWAAAARLGADAYVTGEVKQNVALDAVDAGVAMISAGHYATEQPGMAALCELMAREIPDMEWRLFTPEPGSCGRPAFSKNRVP
jgi:putative NIF3 family GTP cyclohydrolase 1 type 2